MSGQSFNKLRGFRCKSSVDCQIIHLCSTRKHSCWTVNRRKDSTDGGILYSSTLFSPHLNSSAFSVCSAAVVNFDNSHSPCADGLGSTVHYLPLLPPSDERHMFCLCVHFCLFFHCCSSKSLSFQIRA